MKTKCTVVMYHYVRNMHGAAYPRIKGLLVEGFKRQIGYISRNYSVIGLQDYVDFLNGEAEIPGNAAILSFDDGFRDHYDNVFPVLKEEGLTACFFPLTQPLVQGKVPEVHKTHFLLAKLGSKAFSGEFNQALRESFPGLEKGFFVDGKEKKERKYRWDSALTANLKYSIALLPLKVKKEILGGIFGRHFGSEKEFCSGLYMPWEQMKEMKEAGMEFGAHTVSHPMLGSLGEGKQALEIKQSRDELEKGIGCKIQLFSYPYGNYNKATVRLLREAGFVCSVTTEAKVNEGRVDPFKIARLDTNDVPKE